MAPRSSNVLRLDAKRVPKSRFQDHVYDRLSSLILDGEIAPGQSITIQSLSDAFGVSAMPIREALQKMIGIKALTVVSGRSIGIPPLTADRLKDLTRVRIELEGVAGEWATENVTAQDLVHIRNLLDETLQAIQAGDVRRFLRSNREFHFSIYKLARSETAYQIIETLWLQIAPYFHNLYQLDKYSKASIHHVEIFEALESRNGPKVRNGIVEDIKSGRTLLLSTLLE